MFNGAAHGGKGRAERRLRGDNPADDLLPLAGDQAVDGHPPEVLAARPKPVVPTREPLVDRGDQAAGVSSPGSSLFALALSMSLLKTGRKSSISWLRIVRKKKSLLPIPSSCCVLCLKFLQ